MTEIYKEIEGHNDYLVSNMGNVYSKRTEKILRPRPQNGYYTVQIETGKNSQIHRLVANAFLENPLNKRAVDHINGIKTDNNLSNLRFATHAENNANIPKRKTKLETSNYKGVRWRPEGVKNWVVQVQCNGKRFTKCFATEIEGAKWYNEKAKELFGEFAYLNAV